MLHFLGNKCHNPKMENDTMALYELKVHSFRMFCFFPSPFSLFYIVSWSCHHVVLLHIMKKALSS